MENPCEETIQIEEQPKCGLFIITFTNRTELAYRGMAMVRALDAADAERVFLSQTKHNGYQSNIKINKLYQVPDFPDSLLLGEEYFRVK